jgi:hypothetical protein
MADDKHPMQNTGPKPLERTVDEVDPVKPIRKHPVGFAQGKLATASDEPMPPQAA